MQIIKWSMVNQAHLIFTSSSAVYGNKSSKSINESFELNPGTIYASNKISSEYWIKILSNLKKFPWTILRLFPTYGRGHKPNTYQGIVNVMLTQILKSKEIIVKGSLDRERDLIYCNDVAYAIKNCIVNESSYENIFNIGTGISTKVETIIDTIINVLGYSKNNYDIVVKQALLGDPQYSICDNSFAKNKINFKSHFNFEQGVIDMLKNNS